MLLARTQIPRLPAGISERNALDAERVEEDVAVGLQRRRPAQRQRRRRRAEGFDLRRRTGRCRP